MPGRLDDQRHWQGQVARSIEHRRCGYATVSLSSEIRPSGAENLQVVTTARSASCERHFKELQRKVKSITAFEPDG